MKFNQSKKLNWILSALIVFGFASCKKLNSEGFTPGTGAPTIASVRTLSKSTVDSSLIHSTITYNTSGVPTTTSYNNYNPQVSAFDSTTVTGKLNNYYALLGTNLGSTTGIAINGVSVYFNRAWASDNSVIFQIPTTVPYVQPQPNTIVVTTLNGKVTYKFTTLPPPPTIVGESDFDFWHGSQITLTGKGFASVSAVKLRATGDAATIVSQNDSTLVMTMPQSTATETTLLFTFTSGANAAAQTASTTIFNDLDNAYNLFAFNNFQNSWYENSWAGPSGLSTATSHSGTASQEASYPSGNWAIDGFGNNTGLSYDPSFKFFSFWVKGGTVDHHLVLVGDQMHGGYGQVQWDNGSPPSAYTAQVILVPAKVWTYFKIPLATPASGFVQTATSLNIWANGTPTKGLGFFLKGESGDVDEQMYFDEVAFIK